MDVVVSGYRALLSIHGPGGSLDMSAGVLRAWILALDKVSEANSVAYLKSFCILAFWHSGI